MVPKKQQRAESVLAISALNHNLIQTCDKKNKSFLLKSEMSWHVPIKAFPFNLRKKSLRAGMPGKTGRAFYPTSTNP